MSSITPSAHDKREWARMAQAAYKLGLTTVGHRYSVAASLPNRGEMSATKFDQIQNAYRNWLVFNEYPSDNT